MKTKVIDKDYLLNRTLNFKSIQVQNMKEKISPIIKPEELLNLRGAEDLIVFDVSNNPNAKANYDAKHLKGGFFVDINTQLADIKPNTADGGRHPLPTVEKFCETISNLGISPSTHVVIYDDKNGANAAARFWWMLKAVGHEKVQVLDGGLEAAVKAGFPTSDNNEKLPKKGDYKCEKWLLPIADLAEIDEVYQNPDYLIIDVRETPRYKGETEPFDKVAGHIPNTKNIPFAENLDAEGYFLSSVILQGKYSEELENFDTENIIVHCGSGVTACHTLLAFDYAGLEIPKLYVGSWSEWSSNDRPIVSEK
ncbi:MAG: sulfurtransferase [Acidobacteriota bacterium]